MNAFIDLTSALPPRHQIEPPRPISEPVADWPRARSKIFSGSASRWQIAVDTLDFALQPIVSIHTGVCDGCEALLRHTDELGFASIPALFNAAHAEGVLSEVELTLRGKAISKFMEIPFNHRMKLFYNIDTRLLSNGSTAAHITLTNFVHQFGLAPGSFVYEISERHEENMQILNDLHGLESIKHLLKSFRGELFKFAIDDFGTGLSGLQLLYHTDPDYLKIDRFFIDGIAASRRKNLFVSSTVNMARTLGNTIIAEGVETEADFFACHQVGCDYVQGYLVQRPTLDSGQIRKSYPVIEDLQNSNRRHDAHDQEQIRRQLETIRPIPLYSKGRQLTGIENVFEIFRNNKGSALFPVVNQNREPVGVIRENDLKEYVYSPYGKDILRNRSTDSGHITKFITRMPTTEVKTKVEDILKTFSLNMDSEGLLVTDRGKYVGFLSANALLKLLFEKNLEEARDQNPLTKLPGNFLISRFIARGNSDPTAAYIYSYFDFDNFKPFNDKYGLRNGDRAIMMFADILKETANRTGCFIGHVGGDDFFVGFKIDQDEPEKGADESEKLVRKICRRFASDVVSIYHPDDQKKGYIISQDREGNKKRFPLLSVSAAVLHSPCDSSCYTLEEVFTILAELKKQAKLSPDKFAAITLENWIK